jgi:isopentenyl-diphosphate delta-isomerase
VLQPEGTPHFKHGLRALENICKNSKVPVILKETGSGFSPATLRKIRKLGLSAVDVSGLGGTHWGRIEGGRAPGTLFQAASHTFANWGEGTIDSLFAAKASFSKTKKKPELWASGGIRNGLDAAKAIAIGANKVGLAQPALEAALEGEAALHAWMDRIEFELKIALFCTGSKDVTALQKETKWQKI